MHLNNSEDDEDKFSFTGVDTNELKSILYQDVTILAVRVGDRIVLAMFITIIHGKGEDRKPQPQVSPFYFPLCIG